MGCYALGRDGGKRVAGGCDAKKEAHECTPCAENRSLLAASSSGTNQACHRSTSACPWLRCRCLHSFGVTWRACLWLPVSEYSGSYSDGMSEDELAQHHRQLLEPILDDPRVSSSSSSGPQGSQWFHATRLRPVAGHEPISRQGSYPEHGSPSDS